jgi:hypothetical protein
MKRGDTIYRLMHVGFHDNQWTYKVDGPLKVMGEIDGYLMVRKKGAAPFCLWRKDAVDEHGKKLEEAKPASKPDPAQTSPELMKALNFLLNRKL